MSLADPAPCGACPVSDRAPARTAPTTTSPTVVRRNAYSVYSPTCAASRYVAVGTWLSKCQAFLRPAEVTRPGTPVTATKNSGSQVNSMS